MTPTELDRVFGRGRLRMVTGDHVEVFREASAPGERRCYTKRFLATPDGDFREWTEREWRILARLVGHGLKPVPEIVQFDRGSADRPALVQTYDAGVTVDHWATLLPLERDGVLLKNMFEDCAHWWALARHVMIALDAIHELRLVHLDLKADNVCIPVGPAGFDPRESGERSLHPRFDDLTLIDFAFSLVSGERLKSALPIAAQPDYEYQSPRLLQALEVGRSGDLGMTRHLDWRCDFFSFAAMLWRYLPELEHATDRAWTTARHAKASAFVRRLIEVHDFELPPVRPHAQLITLCAETLAAPDLKLSLQRGWTLACDAAAPRRAAPTPITRIAPPLAVAATVAPRAEAKVAPREDTLSPIAAATPIAPPATVAVADNVAFASTSLSSSPSPSPSSTSTSMPMHVEQSDIDARAAANAQKNPGRRAGRWWWAAGLATAAVASTPWLFSAWTAMHDPGPPPVSTTLGATRPPERAVAVAAPKIALREIARTIPATVVPVAPVESPATAVAAVEAPAIRPPVQQTTPPPRQPPTQPPATVAAQPRRAVVHIDAAPIPRPAIAEPVRSARDAAADAAATARLARSAKAEDDAAALMRARAGRGMAIAAPVAAAATRPAPAPTAFPGRATDDPTPWAVTGRPPPAPVAMPTPTPTPTPMPTPMPMQNVSVDAAGDADKPDFGARADELMAAYVPRVAQRVERAVSRTLFLAGRSDNVVGDDEVAGSAAQLGRSAGDLPSLVLASREAESLSAAARNEFARRGATREATLLQVRAFGANPIDPAGAGYLAFLLVRQRPAQAEAARQLALYALSMHGNRYPLGRPEDWSTLAVANALLGRQRDAQNALLVGLAAAPNVERQCRAALDLVAIHGERLRVPAEMLLRSARSASPRPSSLCDSPP